MITRLTYGGGVKNVHLCVSLRLLGLPVEEQSAGYNGLLQPTQSCKCSLASRIMCFPPSHTHTLTDTCDPCTVTPLWLVLTCAFLTEWAEHNWWRSHTCCQGTSRLLWNADSQNAKAYTHTQTLATHMLLNQIHSQSMWLNVGWIRDRTWTQLLCGILVLFFYDAQILSKRQICGNFHWKPFPSLQAEEEEAAVLSLVRARKCVTVHWFVHPADALTALTGH